MDETFLSEAQSLKLALIYLALHIILPLRKDKA